jgi:formate dehydrogenase maturation protein FdhE
MPSEGLSEKRQWLAVRVACNKCGGNELKIMGSNLVRCRKCDQEQSFFLDLNQSDESIVTFPAR